MELVHGDDPERCYGEGGGRGVHVWACMYELKILKLKKKKRNAGNFFSRGKNNKCESCETTLRKFIKTKYPGQIQRSEKAMATQSSTLAWKIPWTEEPGRLQSMGL